MTNLVACFALVLAVGTSANGFELASPDRTATIVVPAGEPECVRLAAEDLVSDVRKITGKTLAIADQLGDSGDYVLLGSVNQPEAAKLLKTLVPEAIGQLRGKWEAYRVETVSLSSGRRALVVAGSDERGTMFGLYAFIEQYLGVDPLYFWTDREPKPRERLAWDRVALAANEPTFRFRGWFVNDEDLLTEWYLDGGHRKIDYPFYDRVVSPKVSAAIFESMLRLGYNLAIPASFVDIRNPDEARLIDEASRRGLFVSMHHVEPMGVSGFAFLNYWRERGEEVPFSFFRHRDKFEAIWRDYAARWAKYPNVIWQLGLRGIADRPVWASDPAAPKTDEGRGKLISDAIALQWEIVRSVDKRPRPLATTTLWMEGAQLHQQGHLRFPPELAVVFSDNSPGWQLQSDFYEVPRQPGRNYGIYYHMALWNIGPHLAQAVSPQKAHAIFSLAVERQSNYYAILNVGNVREFVLGLDAASRMLRDFPGFDPDRYLTEWCRERFGTAAPAAERAYRRYFESYVIDAKANTRHLLDGELITHGLQLLRAMQKGKLKTSRLWGRPERVQEALAKVANHRQAIEAAGAETDAVLGPLSGADKILFEVNFVAQQRILLGLQQWFDGVLRAGLAQHQDDRAAVAGHLRAALAGLATIRSAQTLCVQGKWQDWYRGEKKMNLGLAEELTREILAAAEKP